MSLVNKDDDEDTLEDMFQTSKIPNPQFQRLFQCLLHRALHPNDPLPPIQPHIWDMLGPPEEVTAKCQAPLSQIKTLFPLTEAIRKRDQITAQDVFQDDHEDGPVSKKAKTKEEEGNFSISSLAEGNITSVGSVNPAENFRVLVRRKNANFKEVSCQLIHHIDQFLETKGLQYYMKSLDCIKVFREEAIQLSEEQIFNSFLQALRDKVEDKALNDFWDIVVQDGITLITKDESPGSSVTAEEAKTFLAPKEKPAGVMDVAEEGGDVDDLLDMM